MRHKKRRLFRGKSAEKCLRSVSGPLLLRWTMAVSVLRWLGADQTHQSHMSGKIHALGALGVGLTMTGLLTV